MSANVTPNPIAAVAAQLSAIQVANSEEERLFQQSVRDVCNQQQDPNVVNIVTLLQNSHKPEDITKLFNDSRQANKLWKRQQEVAWTRRLARVSGKFLKFKAFGDSLADLNRIAKPIWGVVCSSLAILEGLTSTDDSLDSYETQLESTLRNTSALYIPGHTLPPYLRTELSHLYKVVIEFQVRVATIFREATIKSWVGVATKELGSELDKFSKTLNQTIDNIQLARSAEDRHDLKDLKDAITFPGNVHQNATVPNRVRHMPALLSKSFTGRQRELDMLHRSLRTPSLYDVPIQTAIVGVGGVGKSQLTLQYVDRHIVRNSMHANHSVLFIQAPSRPSILSHFSQIGEKLSLCNSALAETQPEKLIEKVKGWLESTADWLLVFDSVNDSNHLREFLPSRGTGHILITTRVSTVATTFADPEHIIRLEPLDEISGSELVFSLATAANTNANSPLQQRSAGEIVKLTGGLPLVIEQVIKNAERMNESWEKAIQTCKNRIAFLQQQNFDSNHEANISIGAIVRLSMDSLEVKDPNAVAFFRLLVFMEPSTIQLRLFFEAKDELKKYFERPWPYMLDPVGAVNTTLIPEDTVSRRSLKSRLNFKNALWKRSQREEAIPRIDSTTDIEVQKFWMSQKNCLQAVLEDKTHVYNAIEVLVDAGLVKKTRDSIVIHDVISELAKALMKLESEKEYGTNAHLMSTLVYLTFPPLDRGRELDQLLAHLPHALALHKCMKEIGILNNATIGAELSYITASTLNRVRRLRKNECSFADFPTILEYYSEAYSAYLDTCARIEAENGRSWEEIILATLSDYALEDKRKMLLPIDRILKSDERLGRSPHWRSINTCVRLGLICIDADLFDQAVEYFTTASQWYELVFGMNHYDTLSVMELLQDAQCRRHNYEAAYDIAIRRAKGYMNWTEHERPHLPWRSKEPSVVRTTCSLVMTEGGMFIARQLGGICENIAGKEKEAIKWFEVELTGKENVHGRGTPYCSGAMKRIGNVYEKVGNRSAAVYWFALAVEASLSDMEFDKMYSPGLEGWKKALLQDAWIDEFIDTFKEATADVTDLPPRLESFVWQISSRIKLWQDLREEQDLELAEEARRADAEFEEFLRQLDEFQEKYPPARKVCYDETVRLFKEMGHLYCTSRVVT